MLANRRGWVADRSAGEPTPALAAGHPPVRLAGLRLRHPADWELRAASPGGPGPYGAQAWC